MTTAVKREWEDYLVAESGVGCDDDVVKWFEAWDEARRLPRITVVRNGELAKTKETSADVDRSR